jgi:glucuronokinase
MNRADTARAVAPARTAATERTARAATPARAALAGNPSDGYGGAVLAVTLDEWQAEVGIEPAERLEVTPPSDLVAAAAERFAREVHPGACRTAIRWRTTIPRGVGLGGSSAIVIATVRALAGLLKVTIDPAALADFALAVETEELGIAAGLQDRVAQAYGGLTFMEFAEPRHYESLDPALLPELLIAWRADAAADSGGVHGSLRERHALGEAAVLGAIEELAHAARAAREALLAEDRAAFAATLDRSFELRRAMMELDPRCVEMVDAARAAGAASNYTGSGGAIVAVARDGAGLAPARERLERLGCKTAGA